MKTKTSNETVENPIDLAAEETRNEAVRAVLEPITRAAEQVRVEAEVLAEARQAHDTRVAALKSKKATLDRKCEEMHSYESNEDVDVEELTISTRAAQEGAALIGRQLAKAEAQSPVDDGLQAAWRNLKAHFSELKGRIIRYHRNLAEEALDQIAVIREELIEVRTYCKMCGDMHGDTQTVQSRVSIFFKSEGLQRANALTIGTPGGLNHVALSEQCITDLRVALKEVDLSQLDPYVEPVVQAPIAPIVLPAVPKRKPPTIAKPANQPTALTPMSKSPFGGMVDRMIEAEARNQAQLEEMRKAGTLPRGNPLQVNQT